MFRSVVDRLNCGRFQDFRGMFGADTERRAMLTQFYGADADVQMPPWELISTGCSSSPFS